MKIRCPSAQKIGAGVDFFPVGAEHPRMRMHSSLPNAMMAQRVSSVTSPSMVAEDNTTASSLGRGMRQAVKTLSNSSLSQGVYVERSFSGVEIPPEHCNIGGDPRLNLQDRFSSEGSIANSIVVNIIDYFKKQLDSMSIDLTRETVKLLKSVNAQPPKTGRTLTSPSLSKAPDRSEGRAQQPACTEFFGTHLVPDPSLVPIPVWARIYSSQDAERIPGQNCSYDQPLPSFFKDFDEDLFPDELVSDGQASPSSKASSKPSKNVNLAILDFQREMQRTAVTMEEKNWGTDDGIPSSLHDRRLPKSVSGVWRRQAAILGRKFREDMEEEVRWQVTKNNMSFQGGLWWLHHITGVISLKDPKKAACISLCNILLMIASLSWHLHATSAVPWHMLSSVLSVAMNLNGALALIIHHVCCKLSENCPPTGEQDAILQLHSLAFGYIGEWLKLSRKQGWQLLCFWLASNAAACASCMQRAQALPENSQIDFIVTGSLHFLILSTVISSLCMRVAHICAAMKIALISYMQQFAEPCVDFDDMIHGWNAILIFVRILSDGCAPSLACQVAMIPMMVVGALLQILLIHHTSFLEVFVTITPFLFLLGMPYFALICAADISMQCEQVAQVANSLLVGELANPVAQKLLDFMSRCSLGFFINDLRVTVTGVMKCTYVLVGIFVTVVSSVVER